jgi:hypothetical protein
VPYLQRQFSCRCRPWGDDVPGVGDGYIISHHVCHCQLLAQDQMCLRNCKVCVKNGDNVRATYYLITM